MFAGSGFVDKAAFALFRTLVGDEPWDAWMKRHPDEWAQLEERCAWHQRHSGSSVFGCVAQCGVCRAGCGIQRLVNRRRGVVTAVCCRHLPRWELQKRTFDGKREMQLELPQRLVEAVGRARLQVRDYGGLWQTKLHSIESNPHTLYSIQTYKL